MCKWSEDRIMEKWHNHTVVQSLSHIQLFATPWTAAHQASLSITNPWSLLKLMSVESVIAIQWSHPLPSPSPPVLNLSQHQGLFKWVSSSHQVVGVSASTSVLPMNTQGWSPSEWLVGSPGSPRDSQEFPPTPQFKSINSSALNFLHSPTLTSIHDHWKNHSLD